MIYTVPQAAKLLHIGKEKLNAHIVAGRLKASNVNPPGTRVSYRITQQDIAEFLERGRVIPPPPAKRRKKPGFRRYPFPSPAGNDQG